MGRPRSLTEGNIFSSLIRFAVPVLFTLFLQALYGGVDLLVVGQFAQTADVSGVATGSMLLQTVTMVVTGLSMGITILVVTHDFGVVAELADQVVVLRQGAVIESGDVFRIFDHPREAYTKALLAASVKSAEEEKEEET
mgnify:CR=1 FL=1